ncbi:MAG: VWA domain-containing protein [Candidatus Kapabacteria bacterium]|nr:VWA domain-containing protein [Candidatus Kapabacteria bacterium]
MSRFLLNFICFTIIALEANSQSLSIFKLDTTSYPLMKASFYAFDAAYNQINNIRESDFNITENGLARQVLKVTCTSEKTIIPLSSVLVIDISGSMAKKNLEVAKSAAKAWIKSLDMLNSECAVSSFSDGNQLNQDFTKNRSLLNQSIGDLVAGGGTNYNKALLDPAAGGIPVAKKGINKRVIVMLTDGLPSQEPETDGIIEAAIKDSVTIYAISVGMTCPQCLKTITASTGGLYYENIRTEQDAINAYMIILKVATGSNPCTVEWISSPGCNTTVDCDINLKPLNQTCNLKYEIASDRLLNLEIEPSSINFGNVAKGQSRDTNITLRVINGNLNISNISSSNPNFTIVKFSPFKLIPNNPKTVQIHFKSDSDSLYNFTVLKYETLECDHSISFANAGKRSNPQSLIQTLKIVFPNGNEKLIAGTDTLIKYEGVMPDDTVSLSYSIDGGESWTNITDSATNFKFLWKNIPLPASDSCLIRATLSFPSLKKREQSDDSVRLLESHKKAVLAVAFSPDGKYIATGSVDRSVMIWNRIKGGVVASMMGHNGNVNTVTFSPDSKLIASAGSDWNIIIWDIEKRKQIDKFIGHQGGVRSIAFTPDGSLLVSGSEDQKIKIWDMASGSCLKTIQADDFMVASIAVNHAGTRILSGGYDFKVKEWDFSGNLKQTCDVNGHKGSIIKVGYNFDDTKFMSCAVDNFIKVWDGVSGACLSSIRDSKGHFTSAAFSQFADYAITDDDSYVLKIWDLNLGICSKTISGHNNRINDISFTDDCKAIASVSTDLTIKITDIPSGETIYTYGGHTYIVGGVCFNPAGTEIYSSSTDGTLKKWDASNGNLLKNQNKKGLVYLDPYGKYYVEDNWSYSSTGINVFDLNTNAKAASFIYYNDWSYGPMPKFARDTTIFAYNYKFKNIMIADLKNGFVVDSIIMGMKYESYALSPDSRNIAIACGDSTVKIISLPSHSPVANLKGLTGIPYKVLFSPDGTTMASTWASYQFLTLPYLLIHDLKSGIILSKFTLGSYQDDYKFSPDGTKLIFADNTQTFHLFDIYNNKIIKDFVGHGVNGICLSYSPDGKKVASGAADFRVGIWNLKSDIYLPTDRSDALFSIIKPTLKLIDIDMGKVLVSMIKDSIISDFISNVTCKIKVDSIVLTKKSGFRFVSDPPPYMLASGSKQDAEFSFVPESVGIFADTIKLFCTNNIFEAIIRGEGFLPDFKINTKIIDFGAVNLFDKKDTLVVAIENNSENDFSVDSLALLGPDRIQFEILSPVGFTIKSGMTKEISLRFKPKYFGRTSCDLGFVYKGLGTPAKAQLFGQGIGGIVRINSDSAYPGDLRPIFLTMMNVKKISFQGIADTLIAELQVTGNIIFPYSYSQNFEYISYNIKKDTTEIILKMPLNVKDSVLAQFDVIAALGYSDTTLIKFKSLVLTDKNGDTVNLDFRLIDGSFKIIGICYEGGKRLIEVNASPVGIISISPNPGKDEITLTCDLIEQGLTELNLFDLSGKFIKNLIKTEINSYGERKFLFSAGELPNGEYLIVLKTPSMILNKNFKIVK